MKSERQRMVLMLNKEIAQATKEQADKEGKYLSRFVEQALIEALNNVRS